MSIPPTPEALSGRPGADVANRLHSVAIFLLRKARRVDRATGLSGERLSLLSVLVFGGPQSVSRLAEVEMVSRPAITKAVNALVDLGLARRERSDSDRRRVLVHATGKGRRLMEEGRRRRVEVIAGLLEGLGRRDLEAVDRAAKALAGLAVEGRG